MNKITLNQNDIEVIEDNECVTKKLYIDEELIGYDGDKPYIMVDITKEKAR